MRHRLALVLVAILVVLALVASYHYLSPGNRAAGRIATGSQRDSLARLDSAARADARQDADTMCFASRIGLPCDPR